VLGLTTYARRRIGIAAALVALLGAFGALPGRTPAAYGAAHQTVQTKIQGGVFLPAVVVANAGDTITWRNADSRSHTIRAAAAPATVEGLALPASIAAGQRASVTLTRAGVYDLYGSPDASYDAKRGRVVAQKGAATYPVPMEQVVVVMGPGFRGNASATVTSPGDVFTPYVTVIRQGGTVTFRNTDQDPHLAASTPNSPGRFPQAVVVPGGKSMTVRFAAPGVFEYYCSIHAAYNTAYQQPAALKTADAYPVAMAGFIVVTPPPETQLGH